MNKDIYVVVEHIRGEVSDISYTMLAAARQLADATGGEVLAVLLGSNVENLAKNLSADKVIYLDHANTQQTYRGIKSKGCHLRSHFYRDGSGQFNLCQIQSPPG
jgi:electron transfer flavoprotein alpha subunit